AGATNVQGGGGRQLKTPVRDELKADSWFVPMLESKLSGDDLKQSLAAVSATASQKVGTRDALHHAIDHKEMPAIRKILADPWLPSDDLKKLESDPNILDEMGEELKGTQLCETSLLLRYGAKPFPPDAKGVLDRLQKKPMDVNGAVTFLQNLTKPQQD